MSTWPSAWFFSTLPNPSFRTWRAFPTLQLCFLFHFSFLELKLGLVFSESFAVVGMSIIIPFPSLEIRKGLQVCHTLRNLRECSSNLLFTAWSWWAGKPCPMLHLWMALSYYLETPEMRKAPGLTNFPLISYTLSQLLRNQCLGILLPPSHAGVQLRR